MILKEFVVDKTERGVEVTLLSEAGERYAKGIAKEHYDELHLFIRAILNTIKEYE